MDATQMQRYELWQSADGSELDFFAADGGGGRRVPDSGFVLVWECRASSWNEAQRLKHEHLGWEPYQPMADGT